MADLKKRLQQYVDDATTELRGVASVNQAGDRIGKVQTRGAAFSTQQVETLKRTLQRLIMRDWITVSCVDIESIKAARAKLEEIVVTSNRSFPTPGSYSKTLDTIRKLRAESSSKGSSVHIRDSFREVMALIKHLHVENPEVDDDTHREILRTLHDLGDVLWYENLGIERLKNEVILDPMRLIDFIRPIANHNFKSEVIPHKDLDAKPYWLHLNEDEMLMLKRLLQEFNIVHAPRQNMRWSSDLIVPASWKSRSQASIRFGGQSLDYEFFSTHPSSNTTADSVKHCTNEIPRKLSVNLRWEYCFASLLPEAIFDEIVIASYSSLIDRLAGPDWIPTKRMRCMRCALSYPATKQP